MLRVGQLARPGGGAQLPRNLADRVPATDMGLRQQPARRVDRQRATRLDAAALHPACRLAGAAEAEALEREQDQRREGVVSVEAGDVLVLDAGAVEQLEIGRTRRRRLPGRLLVDAETGRREDELVTPGADALHRRDRDRL